jgi:hypothetical protein
MKRALLIFPFAFLLSACDQSNNSATALKSTPVDSPRTHPKEMGLTYTVASTVNGEAGHQAFRFGETWASSREDIIQSMSLAGWQLNPDYRSSDAVIRFYSDTPGPLADPSNGIRWERN